MTALQVHGPSLDLTQLAPILAALGLELGNVVALTVTPYTWAAAVLLTDEHGHPVYSDEPGPDGEPAVVLTTRYGSVYR